MRRNPTIACLAGSILLVTLSLVSPAFGEEARAVDLVICLDTSGSMKSLLDDVRARLWDVVNELGVTTPTPALRVGLLSYGSRGTADGSGSIIIHTDLTRDLDEVFDNLMRLEVSGADEYVGWVLATAVEELSWSEDDDALRIIFVAGNESADQGVEHHDFRDAAAEAQDRDILINAIYAGAYMNGVRDKWLEIAEASGGIYAAVGTRGKVAQIETPQDRTLQELNAELNRSYVPFGPKGQEHLANMKAQDKTAAEIGAHSLSSRVAAKGGGLYADLPWDLVDATERSDFEWAGLTQEDLPAEWRGLSEDELMAAIEQRRAERRDLLDRIREVHTQRERFLESRPGSRAGAVSGVGDAMRQMVRKQARARGFQSDE